MTILCLGLSHHATPVALRERLNLTTNELELALAQFHAPRYESISELALLSTCNRFELYVRINEHEAQQESHDPFALLLNFIVEACNIPAIDFETFLYRHTGTQAMQHLCRVAAGLDSMLLGETQILGQVTDTHEIARAQNSIGPVLSALFQCAIRAGKRARTETAIARGSASIISVALRSAQSIVGDLANCHALVIGAGEMGRKAVNALHARGVKQIAVANRTVHHALELTAHSAGHAYSLEQLPDALATADIVIAASASAHPIIDSSTMHEALRARAGQPVILIDIAVPRNVDPSVRKVRGVHLLDMDDLQQQTQDALDARRKEIPRVEAIVEEEVAAFESWLRELEITPLIKDLRHKAEVIRQRELERTLRHLPDLDPQTREQIQRLSRSLINKLLHDPTVRLRAEASNGHAAEYTKAIRHLFGLETKPTEHTVNEEED